VYTRDVRLSGIDANLLVALHALLTERSVTRAAARIGVTQPALSHSLARLRDHFDDPLLVKKGRELVLSNKAAAMIDAVAEALDALGRVFEAGAPFDPKSPRAFVVACADLFALRFVPPVLAALRREAPAIDLEVRPLAARASLQILDDGVELAFGVFEDLHSSINQQQLFRDPFVCVVRRRNPRVKKNALSLEAYLASPHLEVSPAPRARPGDRISRVLAARGHRRRVTTRVPYFALAARILAESDLVLTMTRRFAEQMTTLAPLRIVRAPIDLASLSFSQIWDRRHDDDAAHAWLRALCHRVIST
jgi:DNA-binding transcriptional LysR family regulator